MEEKKALGQEAGRSKRKETSIRMGIGFGPDPSTQKDLLYWHGRGPAFYFGFPGADWHVTLLFEGGDPKNLALSCHFTRKGEHTHLGRVLLAEVVREAENLYQAAATSEQLLGLVGDTRRFVRSESFAGHQEELLNLRETKKKKTATFRVDEAAKYAKKLEPMLAHDFPFDSLAGGELAISVDEEGEVDHAITVVRLPDGAGWLVNDVRKSVAIGNRLVPLDKIAPLLSTEENKRLEAEFAAFAEAGLKGLGIANNIEGTQK